VIGDKLGDNAQVEVVARALAWPTEVKRLKFQPQWQTGKPPFKPSLYHVDVAASDPLVPPWPDLVLTVGRRPSMAALWIRAQSGGQSRVVIVGRPRRHLEDFALVLAPPQYRLPRRANVVHLDLPLMRVDEEKVTAAAAAWRERMSGLVRPLTAVLVGGPTKPFVFDAAVTASMIGAIERSTGGVGSLFVSTSRRTPDEVVNALITGLPPSAVLFRWRPEATENPYHALLGLADRFVVTGDSVSMIVEVARLGRPLAIFPLPVATSPVGRLKRWLAAKLQPEAGTGRAAALAALGNRLYALGVMAYARDFDALHQRLIARGLAVWLGQPFNAEPARAPDDLDRAVARIRALFAADDHGAEITQPKEI
jgi:mitochondrial fission protein ELM1